MNGGDRAKSRIEGDDQRKLELEPLNSFFGQRKSVKHGPKTAVLNYDLNRNSGYKPVYIARPGTSAAASLKTATHLGAQSHNEFSDRLIPSKFQNL